MGPILIQFDDPRPTKFETDASDFALRVLLSQLCEHEKWHLVAFDSRSFSSAEINYDVHDKEMVPQLWQPLKNWHIC